MESGSRAVFLDKDGTLIEDLPYNVDPEKISLTPRCGEGLRMLRSAGYKLIVVSNQPGLDLGYFTREELVRAEAAVRSRLYEQGVSVAAFYYCPHAPAAAGGGCACRKPEPGLLLTAAREHAVDLARSWFIGDILNDVEAGRRAGCRTVLLDRGSETEWVLSPARLPHHIVADLAEAAWVIATLT